MHGRPRPAPQGGLASDTVTPSTVLTRYTLCVRLRQRELGALCFLVSGVAPVLVNQDGRLFDSTQIHAALSLSAPANAAASKVPFPCLSGNPLRLAPPGRP